MDGTDTLASVRVPGSLRTKGLATVNGQFLEIRSQGVWSAHFVVVDSTGREVVKLEIGRRNKLNFLNVENGSVTATYLLHRTAIFGWQYELLTERSVSLAQFELNWDWRKLGHSVTVVSQIDMSREVFAGLMVYVVFIAQTQERRTGNL